MLTITEVKALHKGDRVFIVDNENDTTIPPHKTERYYKILENYGTELFCACLGYSHFYFDDYGTKWFAYKNKEECN